MSEKTAEFYFRNEQDVEVELVIEPWALVYQVASGDSVRFEVNAAPSPEIEFSITETGRPYVYVMSERVLIEANGKKEIFNTQERPPMEVFRTLRRVLWPS